MNRLCTAVDDMRFNRKRFSISGSLLPLLLLLVLLVVQTSARPSSVNGTIKNTRPTLDASTGDIDDGGMADVAFDAGDDYTDVDNVEWHHVKIVDGIMHEDHPIIMYKEDFVSEDYDPSQQRKGISAESNSHERRKYKHQQRQRLNRTEQTTHAEQTEKYHALKPEKIYFDILPPTPVVVTDDSSTNDSKFDPANIRVEVISLLDDEDAANKAQSSSIINDDDEDESPSKELLNKRPKKYHHRMRRDTTGRDNGEHTVHKRHPHYNYGRVGSNSFDDYNRHFINNWGQKHAVQGNKWNGINDEVPPPIDFEQRFGGDDNTDRVVWGVSRADRPRPAATKRPQPSQPAFPPLIHNSNPDDADFSVFRPQRPSQNNNRRPTTTRRPQQPQFPPLIHDSNPDNADFSGFNRPPRRQHQHQQQQQHRKQSQILSFASRSESPRDISTVNLTNDKAGNKPKTDFFDILDAETAVTPTTESELFGVKDATQCEKATSTCCEMTELSRLYDCFYHAKCTRSIAMIMSMCA